ncbi:MAG: hypothetical protein AAF529_19555 [Pseudomonadota bacterium]
MNHIPQRYSRQLTDSPVQYEMLINDMDSSRWLVLVHGINRDVDALLRWFGEPAQTANFNLIAPVFSAAHYPDYQRLGRQGLGARADKALLSCLSDARWLGLSLPAQLPLFGFSGGAQFAHRFALAHGQHLSALICAAAGWYTPLDPARKYPNGLAPSKRLPDLHFSARKLLSMPTLTLVGAEDVETDSAVRDRPEINHRQGLHRRSRAEWWHQHLLAQSQTQSHTPRHLLQVMPGCDHGMHTCALHGAMASRVFAFLRLVQPPAQTRLTQSQNTELTL